MAILESKTLLLDFTQGLRTNVQIVGGKLKLSIIANAPDNSPIYFASGTFVSSTIDLSEYIQTIKTISTSLTTPANTSTSIYTSTSNDNITFSDYLLLNADGSIASPQGRYLKIKIEFTSQEQLATLSRNQFDSSETTQFEVDDQVTLDGFLRLKINHTAQLVKDTTFTDTGFVYSTSVRKPTFKKINTLEVR